MCLEKLRIERKEIRLQCLLDARKVNLGVFRPGVIAVNQHRPDGDEEQKQKILAPSAGGRTGRSRFCGNRDIPFESGSRGVHDLAEHYLTGTSLSFGCGVQGIRPDFEAEAVGVRSHRSVTGYEDLPKLRSAP